MFTTLMRGSRWYVAILIAACAIMLFTAGAALADVTVQKLVKSGGMGGFGAFETTEKMMISGDKECTREITKYSGKFSSLMNKGAKETISITRLDKELIWNVDNDKKTYTELTFEQMKQMMESMSALLSNPAKQDSLRQAMEQLSTTVDVKKTGEKKTVAGLECERVILSLEGVHVDTIWNTTDTTWVKNDVWITPMKNVPSELYDFDMKMAEKMGFTEGGPMAGLLNQYADAMKKLQDKLKELNGYPLASTFSIVTTTHAQEKQKGEVKPEEVTEQETEEETPVTEKKDVKSALGGLFGKKAKEEAKKKEAEKQQEKAAQEQAQLGQPKTVMEVNSETQSIETSGIDASTFEIPAGYKKVEMKGMEK
ncbi:MAG TPA: hypothetical protein VF369_06595 [candidate division Zixibacteria bacterium]